MIGTDAFRTAWRGVSTRKPYTIISVGPFTDGPLNGKTLWFSSDTRVSFNGVLCEPLLKTGSISARSDFLSTDVDLATCTFILHDRPSTLTGLEPFSALLAVSDFINMPVTVWLMERTLSDADALQRFTGFIQTYATGLGFIQFQCMQSRDWNRQVPRIVTRAEFPQAPEDAIGAALPVIYGKVNGVPQRRPFAAPYSVQQHVQELLTGGQRMTSAVLVDAGRGASGTPGKMLVAGHKVKQIGLGGTWGDYGTSVAIDADGVAHIMKPSTSDFFNATTGAGLNLQDDALKAWANIIPADVQVITNMAENPRSVLDLKDETTIARLDYSASQRNLYCSLSTTKDFGTLVQGFAYLLFRASSTVNAGQFRLWNTVNSSGVTTISQLPAASALTLATITLGSSWGNAMPTNPWQFGDCRLEVTFNWPGVGTPAGWIEVYALGLAIEYKVAQPVLETTKTTERVELHRSPRMPRRGIGNVPPKVFTIYAEREVVTNITEFKGKLLANVHGHMDDGEHAPVTTFGGFLGQNSLIERAPYIAKHLLAVYGGVPLASFNDSELAAAAAQMMTRNGNPMVFGLAIDKALDVSAVLSTLMASSVAHCWPAETDGRWRFTPWRTDPDVTYPLELRKINLIGDGISIRSTPANDVLSGIELLYGWDAASSSFAHKTSVSAAGSVSGHLYRNLRDQALVITAGVNDKLDIGFPTPSTYTLAAGTYTEAALVTALESLIGGVPTSNRMAVAVGGTIVAGKNDKVRFYDGTTVHNITLDAGTWTMGELQDMLQTKMNAAIGDGTIYVIWNTNGSAKFRIGRLFGLTLQLQWQLIPSASAAAVYGFAVRNETGASEYTSHGICGSGLVALAADAEMDVLWRTGTSGLLGTRTSASVPLGFDERADSIGTGVGVAGWRHVGVCPVDEVGREALLAASDARYGRKREVSMDARAIYDTDTAIEARNRLIDLLRKTRGVIKFPSEVHADMERGDVFPCADELSALHPYPFGVSAQWSGRKFLALETVQAIGDSYETEVVAVDVTD